MFDKCCGFFPDQSSTVQVLFCSFSFFSIHKTETIRFFFFRFRTVQHPTFIPMTFRLKRAANISILDLRRFKVSQCMVWSFISFICIHFNIEKKKHYQSQIWIHNVWLKVAEKPRENELEKKKMFNDLLSNRCWQIEFTKEIIIQRWKTKEEEKQMSRRWIKGDWIEWFWWFDLVTKLFICIYEWMGWFQNTTRNETEKKNIHSNVLLTIQMKLIVKWWYSEWWRIGIYIM